MYNEAPTIAMEQPSTGGRHRKTFTYGKTKSNADLQEYLQMDPKDALEFDLDDVRRVYKEEGLYDAKVERALQQLKERVLTLYQPIFK